MFSNISSRIHPVNIEVICAERIRKTAMKTRGKSYSSGLNKNWKLLSNKIGESSSDLCQTITSLTKMLCTEKLSTSIEKF